VTQIPDQHYQASGKAAFAALGRPILAGLGDPKPSKGER
jgi:hypothetical protein